MGRPGSAAPRVRSVARTHRLWLRADRSGGRRRLVLGASFALLVLTGACNGDAGGESRATTTAVPAASTTTQVARAPTTSDPAIRIVLGAGRLTVGGNALVFDAPASQVSSYLERALGDPSDESDQDCGPGRLRTIEWPGLQVFLLDGRLAGWMVEDDTYATDKGVTLGSTRTALQTAYPSVTFPESSLGEEFFVEATGAEPAGLSGLLLGEKISALWSGATCVAR